MQVAGIRPSSSLRQLKVKGIANVNDEADTVRLGADADGANDAGEGLSNRHVNGSQSGLLEPHNPLAVNNL